MSKKVNQTRRELSILTRTGILLATGMTAQDHHTGEGMIKEIGTAAGRILLLALLSGCSPGGHSEDGTTAAGPNVLMIVADDLGWDDLGVHGNERVRTPHLDRLARESVCFEQFLVTPVCATTRASLLTGRHFLRTGVSHVHGGKDFLHLEETTLAETLQNTGYATGMWGKWHSGKTEGYYPWQRGFQEAFMARLYHYRDNRGLNNGRAEQTEGWVTRVLTDKAIRFMEEHREEPFFAYLPYLTCHAPLDAPEEFIRPYREAGLSENLATLYGMITHMDHHIGRLLSALEEMDLEEETVVLFLSDNGPAILNGQLTPHDREIRYVSGMRGHKGNIWENGIRSPLFVKWNGTFEPGRVERLADVTDLFPTLAEMAGIQPESLDSLRLDGRSLVPLLTDARATPEEKFSFLYANPGWPPSDRPWSPEGVNDEYRPWKHAGGNALDYGKQIIGVRGERYKLLRNPGVTGGSVRPDSGGRVLVDLAADPGESRNLADSLPGLLHALEERLKEWYGSLLEEPHAFEMPVFRAGRDPEKQYEILLYAPHHTTGTVRSASNYIVFENPGDSARYVIRVEQEGDHRLEIRYEAEGDLPQHYRLVLPGAVSELELQPGKSVVETGPVKLISGNVIFTLARKPGSGGRCRIFSATIHAV